MFFSRFLGTDSRSRRARAPWIVRSVDIFSFAVGSSAQMYMFFFSAAAAFLLAFARSAVRTTHNIKE